MVPKIIEARNVNDALARGLNLMRDPRIERENSRNGRVSVWPGPVITQTKRPLERVLFSHMRNANPFFHLFESLWMLGGRNDLPWLVQFNKQMNAYSDDGGQTQPAAYGHRWRNFFGYDQLDVIVEELKRNPSTRRCVLSMWNGGGDRDNSVLVGVGDLMSAINGSADVPCNTQCFFTIRGGKLDMAVTCRSNDILWGAHGANAVHFSILLEYIAARVGVAVGEMVQFSWNYHMYGGILKHSIIDTAQDCLDGAERYAFGSVHETPIFDPASMEQFHVDLPLFLEYASPANALSRHHVKSPELAHPFLRDVALPMLRSWDWRKAADLEYAVKICHTIAPGDWQTACMEWMERRFNALHMKRIQGEN